MGRVVAEPLLFQGDCFIEDFSRAEDRNVVHKCDGDAVRRPRIDFNNLSNLTHFLLKKKASKVDRVLDITDDHLLHRDMKPFEDHLYQVVGQRTRLLYTRKVHLEGATDPWIRINGKTLFLGSQNNNRVGTRLHDLIKCDRDQFRTQRIFLCRFNLILERDYFCVTRQSQLARLHTLR